MEWWLPQPNLSSLFSVFRTPLMDTSATAQSKVTPIFVSPYLPRWDNMGHWSPRNILDHLRVVAPKDHCYIVSFSEPLSSMAPLTSQPAHSSSCISQGHTVVSVIARAPVATVRSGSGPVEPYCWDVIGEVLSSHDFTEPVMYMPSALIQDLEWSKIPIGVSS